MTNINSSVALYARPRKSGEEPIYHWALSCLENTENGTVYHCEGEPRRGMRKVKKTTRGLKSIGLIYLKDLPEISEQSIPIAWETTYILYEDTCADFIIRVCKTLGRKVNKEELVNRANTGLRKIELGAGFVMQD